MDYTLTGMNLMRPNIRDMNLRFARAKLLSGDQNRTFSPNSNISTGIGVTSPKVDPLIQAFDRTLNITSPPEVSSKEVKFRNMKFKVK